MVWIIFARKNKESLWTRKHSVQSDLSRNTFITRTTLDQNAQQVTACLRQGPEMTLMALGTAVIATVLLELLQFCKLTVNSFIY